jgi:hypothetical protein
MGLKSLVLWGSIGALTGLMGMMAWPLLAQEDAGRIEITIKNSTYQFEKKMLRPDQPVTIVLRNQDTIEHGFVSPLLQSTDVTVETAGGTTFGRGIKGVHIAPGKELSIHLTPAKPGQFSFQCDLHPTMKGELFLLSIGAA